MSEYLKQAKEFLNKTNSKMEIKFLKNDFHFTGDKEKRDIYNVTITRGSRSYSFNFGNSLNNSGFKIVNKAGRTLRSFSVPDKDRDNCIRKGFGFTGYSYLLPYPISNSERVLHPVMPNEYDILACLTKCDPGTFDDFCSEFGYDTDSKTAEKTYNAVVSEYQGMCALFTDEELELMQEIS